MQQWIPVGYEPEMHLSASYQEAIGQAYLTLHPNNFTMMEAMVHEFQHNKINALMHLDPLLENAFFPLFSSPVRPDPRPLHGILLAVHAFLPVAELYRRLRAQGVPELSRPDIKRRLQTIVEGNHQGMEVLRKNGKWTEVGARFFAQLDVLDALHVAQELDSDDS
jgi:HEXXH motif-containing protein